MEPRTLSFDRLIACAFFLLMCCSSGVHAQVPAIVAKLQAQDYATLDAEMNDAQKRFEAGELDEDGLRKAFQPFGNARLRRFEPQLLAWAAQLPQSYAAHFALGRFYLERGVAARGNKYYEKTSKAQIDSMTHDFQLAEAQLRQSLPLTAKPYLSLFDMMAIAGHVSGEAQLEALLLMANEALPGNTGAHMRFARYLLPRWGGSYASFDQFIERSRKEGASPSLLQQMAALEHNDRGMVLSEKGEAEDAKAEYTQALELARQSGGDPDRFSRMYLAASLRHLCNGADGAASSACPAMP